jgi:hypothetical protein
LKRLLDSITAKILFSHPPVVKFESANHRCSCGGQLKILKTHKKKIWTLEIGPIIAHEKVRYCDICHNVYPCDELKKIVSNGSNFSFDVMVYIGKAMFLRCRNVNEIREELNEKNIRISPREIGYLGVKFIIYLAIAHREMTADIKNYLSSQGGYILHLDATCDKGSPHLMTGLDEITELILSNVKLPSENSKDIIPFLTQIKKNYGNPLALVHDMGKGICLAVNEVFPGTPDFICHFHFLRDIGKDLFGPEYAILRDYLRDYNIRSELRRYVKELKQCIDDDPTLTRHLNSCRNLAQIPHNPNELPSIVTAYLCSLWVLDAKNELYGYGFPFDREHLVFYQRLKQADSLLKKISSKGALILLNLRSAIISVICDSDLGETVTMLTEKTVIFDQLRTAMRIALPCDINGLNDSGHNSDVKTIKENVTAFRNSEILQKMTEKHIAYVSMVNQIDKYWDKLFADPIIVPSSNGDIVIQPQRTNNILEKLFRDVKKHYRKKTGCNSMARTLKSMIDETPLVKNLENPKYLEILLNGKPTLAERFAEIDSQKIRTEMNTVDRKNDLIPNQFKKLIRIPEFLTKLTPKHETDNFSSRFPT